MALENGVIQRGGPCAPHHRGPRPLLAARRPVHQGGHQQGAGPRLHRPGVGTNDPAHRRGRRGRRHRHGAPPPGSTSPGVGDKVTQPSLLLRAGNSLATYDAVQLAFSFNGGSRSTATRSAPATMAAPSPATRSTSTSGPARPSPARRPSRLHPRPDAWTAGTSASAPPRRRTPRAGAGCSTCSAAATPSSRCALTTGKIDARVLAHDDGLLRRTVRDGGRHARAACRSAWRRPGPPG